MVEYSPIECEFLLENRSCKAVIENGEGKMTRDKWCEACPKTTCCYLCIRRMSCDISCAYLNKRTSEDKVALRLRFQIWEMISKKAKLGFPLTERDCSPEERLEIDALVQMLHKFEENMSNQRSPALSQNNELQDENTQLMIDVDKKIDLLAKSISRHVLAGSHVDFKELIAALKSKGVMLEKFACPHCGGLLEVTEIPKKEQMLRCKYCGSSILSVNLYEKFKDILKQ